MGARDPYEESTRGPGYWDVQEAMRAIKARWTGDVFFETSCHLNRHDGKVHWWLIAKVRIWSGPYSVDWVQAGAQFLGNGGAKTMPAAMHLALCRCIDKLEARELAARAQARF